MAQEFDSETITERGWRQGAILGDALAMSASKHAPQTVGLDSADWLVLTSHDCDIVNGSIEKEPFVEILRMSVVTDGKVDQPKLWGRNPRTLQLTIEARETPVFLSCNVHDRWTIPRTLLMQDSPARTIPEKERRLIAEWLAKRYIRAAFPTAFDQRWRSKQKQWQYLLQKHSCWIQGVYLRLNTLHELPEDEPYKCHLMLAVPHMHQGDMKWTRQRAAIEDDVQSFWDQFEPGVQCAEVEVLRTDEITLADIEPYQRFDADWVSFEDDTAVTPLIIEN